MAAAVAAGPVVVAVSGATFVASAVALPEEEEPEVIGKTNTVHGTQKHQISNWAGHVKCMARLSFFMQ